MCMWHSDKPLVQVLHHMLASCVSSLHYVVHVYVGGTGGEPCLVCTRVSEERSR